MSSDNSNVTNLTTLFALPHGTNHFAQAEVPLHALNAEVMDVAFTKATTCAGYPGDCEGLKQDHRFAEAVSLGGHFAHKYLLDLDGHGYSARFLAFLASESAVIKSTIYREFFSDWIQPW
jgi:hypothetical protein